MTIISKSRRVLLAVGAAFFLAHGASAAKQRNDGKAGAPARSFREVTDEAGRMVRIPQPVERIVSLAPSLTETVYALGLQDLLVGDTDYCDYPADAMKKHKVGGAINPNMEEVAALHPDVVLVTKGLNRVDTVHALEQLGIAAYATNPQTVEEIVSSSRRLADVLGAPEAGEKLAADLDGRLRALRERLQGVRPRKVLFVVWSEPLISIGQKTFIADALRHAGAESIVESPQDWPHVNLEEVVRLQPEFLVFAAKHGYGEEASRDIDVLSQRPGWSSMTAVRERKFAVISDAVNRPAPRIVSAIEDLAKQLHPEVFGSTGEGADASGNAAAERAASAGHFEELCVCAR